MLDNLKFKESKREKKKMNKKMRTKTSIVRILILIIKMMLNYKTSSLKSKHYKIMKKLSENFMRPLVYKMLMK